MRHLSSLSSSDRGSSSSMCTSALISVLRLIIVCISDLPGFALLFVCNILLLLQISMRQPRVGQICRSSGVFDVIVCVG